MPALVGTDQFALNGIPSDIEAMAAAYPFGWYQLTNGMTVNIMARRAWPTYAKHYGGYHFFSAAPDNNWVYQSWDVYAEECARLFALVMGGNYGGCAPMIDAEAGGMIPLSTLVLLFPAQSPAQRIASGNALYLRLLQIVCDTVETLTGKIPVLYTGKSFWEEIGGASATWAARLPLCVAVYPYDNYTNPAEYLAAIQGVMAGTKQLPPVAVPAPWTAATYVQFTGRAPVSLIPGYATGTNWAKTADMSIQVANIAPAPVPTPTPTPTPPPPLTATVIPARINIRSGPLPLYPFVRYAVAGEVLSITNITKNGYTQLEDGNWVWAGYIKII